MIFNIPVGGKAKVMVSICGAADEDVALTDKNGKTVATVRTNADGIGSTIELKVGTYTVTGSSTGYTQSKIVTKTTTMVGAFPDVTFFWHGYKGKVGGWTSSGYANHQTTGGSESVGTSLYVECVCWDQYNKYRGRVLGSANPIDVTNLKKIVFRASSSDSDYGSVGITQDKGNATGNGKNVAVGESNDYAIDVSDLTGNYYPYISTWVYDWGAKTTTATRIYAE